MPNASMDVLAFDEEDEDENEWRSSPLPEPLLDVDAESPRLTDGGGVRTATVVLAPLIRPLHESVGLDRVVFVVSSILAVVVVSNGSFLTRFEAVDSIWSIICWFCWVCWV